MSNDQVRSEFEALYSVPPMTQWSKWHKEYVPALESMINEARNYTSMFYAYCAGRQQAVRQSEQGGEPVAWVKVPEGDQDSSHYAGYAWRGIKKLLPGNHHLYTTPQPSAGVPEGWKLVPVEPSGEMKRAAFDEFGPFIAGRVWDCMLAAAPQPPAKSGCKQCGDFAYECSSCGGKRPEPPEE